MDQMKIGRFIATCRKGKGITQSVLAEKMGVSDRAVSKWETGKNMPDSGSMLELCEILGVSVNELLTGEKMSNMEDYKKEAEKHLIELNAEKEQHAKNLLRLRPVIAFLGIAAFCVQLLASVYAPNSVWTIILFISAIVELIVAVACSSLIASKAGFYECENCHERYIPHIMTCFFAPHRGLSKYLKCPYCGKRTWNRKRLTK